MEFTPFLISVFLLLLGLPLGLARAIDHPKNPNNPPPCRFPAIYNFGDSNSDTGGISAAFEPIPPPYGEAFFRKPAGRNCDGRLLIDFIAERLRIPYLSAYLNSLGTSYQRGANFATGGATIREQNETIEAFRISPFPLNLQIVQFNQFKNRATDLYNTARKSSYRKHLPRPKDFSKALYTIDIGQNDLFVAFQKMSFHKLRAAMPDMVHQIASAVQDLYGQGARTFWIHNTGPIGCLPASLVYVRDPPSGFLDQNGCIKAQNHMALEFNKRVKDSVRKLRVELTEAAITYVDVYAAKYRLISSAKKLGFDDPLKICCGYHEGGEHVWCGRRGSVNGSEIYGGSCTHPANALSWDGVHYTQAANHWVAQLVLSGSLTDPPTPITEACHRRT